MSSSRMLIALSGCLILGISTMIRSRVVALDTPIAQQASKATSGYFRFNAELLATPTNDLKVDGSKITLRNTSTGELITVYPANLNQTYPSPYGTAHVFNNAGSLTLTSWQPIMQSTQADWLPLGRATRVELTPTGLLIWISGHQGPFNASSGMYTSNLIGRLVYGSTLTKIVSRIAPEH